MSKAADLKPQIYLSKSGEEIDTKKLFSSSNTNFSSRSSVANPTQSAYFPQTQNFSNRILGDGLGKVFQGLA